MAKFELVSRFANNESTAYALPTRATARAAGYDLYAAEEVVIPPYNKLMYALMEESDENKMAPLEYSLPQMAALTKSAKAKPTGKVQPQ